MAETPTEQAPGNALQMSARVGESVDLYEIRLIAQDTRYVPTDEPPTLLRGGHHAEAKRDNEAGKILIEASFSLDMAHDTDEARDNPNIMIRAAFQLAYVVKDLARFTDEEIDAFGRMNGVYNAWPFWRELVYSTMARMGVPPITLPTFRFDEQQDAEPENG